MNNEIILRLPEVKKRTGLSRTTIYERVKSGQLKAPVKLGTRAIGWLESDVSEFIGILVKTSRSQ